MILRSTIFLCSTCFRIVVIADMNFTDILSKLWMNVEIISIIKNSEENERTQDPDSDKSGKSKVVQFS